MKNLIKAAIIAIAFATAIPAMAITELTDDNFEKEVLGAKTPVIMVMYATWCDYCTQLKEVIKKREAALTGKVKFVQVNVETTSLKGKVRALPTTILLKNGKAVKYFEGFDIIGLEVLLDEAAK